jgi:hypothetical protein
MEEAFPNILIERWRRFLKREYTTLVLKGNERSNRGGEDATSFERVPSLVVAIDFGPIHWIYIL